MPPGIISALLLKQLWIPYDSLHCYGNFNSRTCHRLLRIQKNSKQLNSHKVDLLNLCHRFEFSLSLDTMIVISVVVVCLLQCRFLCQGAPLQESKFAQIPSGEALKFLKRFGYVQEDNGESEALYTEEGISDIIKTMQRFGAIEETGVFDNATLKLMSSPRCGVPDIIRSSRQKRFVLGPSGWEKRNLTYYLANWSPKLGEDMIVKNIQKALDIWADYGRLHFRRVLNPDADIIVAFGSGYHGDIFPFDGPGNILAHAFFPSTHDPMGGDIHFDDDEMWVDGIENKEGTQFFAVALHELGHSLGLAHTPVESSVMFPYYKLPESGGTPQLGYDDILGMYDLYIYAKTARNRRHNTTNNIAPDIPDICDGRLDAVATLRDELFVFRGQYVWRYKEKRRLEKGYPVKLHDMFPKLPKSITKIDAAYQRPDGMIVIFTDSGCFCGPSPYYDVAADGAIYQCII
nr:matrix metalloproteinase-2-like [Leptinotarsa decemlineata]